MYVGTRPDNLADLLALLNESHVPAPRLVSTREGQPFLEMEGGRVSVFAWLPGEELTYDYCTVGSHTIQCLCRPGCKTRL